ncbi:MAG: BlaI/MecI/CopY family transcriptional regulator [Oscillospiraceae bacterium]|nr:BlaI/MecI/CopY family transcriptional regulator [Oscillospiraceae bacterium]
MKRLGDAELEIMLAVWNAEGPVQSTYIHQRLRASRNWALPAVVTAMNRLVEKGFLSSRKEGRCNLYSPLITAQAYRAAEGRSVLNRLYGGSFTGMAAALYDGKAIQKKDLDELRQYLDQLEEE